MKKPTDIEQQQASKQERIAAMYSRGYVAKILDVEKKWGLLARQGQSLKLLHFEYATDTKGKQVIRRECDAVHSLIHGAAIRWARLYKDKRIPFEDFLSAFYETAWQVIERYTWATDFYLYETLSKAIQKRGKAILRYCLGADCRKVLHESLPLVDGFEDLFSWRSARLF